MLENLLKTKTNNFKRKNFQNQSNGLKNNGNFNKNGMKMLKLMKAKT